MYSPPKVEQTKVKEIHPVKSAEGGVSPRSGAPASQEALVTRKAKQFNRVKTKK
ncbi:MAG: hypothetical protein Q8K40_05220 [Ignavibacteria bacterium]|nr:hypothetical protein [Ignavibacteria bacterium]